MIVGIIQARMGSTRLPGKILKEINGRPILWWVVQRIRRTQKIGKIIIATSVEKQDDVVEEYCLKNGIDVIRGSENDVLDRYYQTAKKYNAQTIVRMTCDCPLIDMGVIDKLIDAYLNNSVDLARNTNFKNSYPSGFDGEVFSFQLLERCWNEIKDIKIREHVVGKVGKEFCRVLEYTDLGDNTYNKLHLSVDTIDDFNRIEKILCHFNRLDFTFMDVMNFLHT